MLNRSIHHTRHGVVAQRRRRPLTEVAAAVAVVAVGAVQRQLLVLAHHPIEHVSCKHNTQYTIHNLHLFNNFFHTHLNFNADLVSSALPFRFSIKIAVHADTVFSNSQAHAIDHRIIGVLFVVVVVPLIYALTAKRLAARQHARLDKA